MEAGQQTPAHQEGLFRIPKRWFKLGFFGFLLAWLTYMVYEASGWIGFEDYLFIYILAPIIYGLLLYRSILLVAPDLTQPITDRLDFIKSDADATEESGMRVESDSLRQHSKAEEEKYAIYMLAWLIALPVAIFLFGMAWVLPVYIFGFVWFFTGNPKRATAVTIMAVVFMYVLFIEILNVLLYTGYFGLPSPLEFLP